MPNIEDIIQRLVGKKFFANLDLVMGYHQWLVEEKSIALTAFVTAKGFSNTLEFLLDAKTLLVVFNKP